ncbi:MAG: hypothetical protein RL212_570 [Pseudomonadota bacterium]
MMQTPDPQQRLSTELTSTSYINVLTNIQPDIILVCFMDMRFAFANVISDFHLSVRRH